MKSWLIAGICLLLSGCASPIMIKKDLPEISLSANNLLAGIKIHFDNPIDEEIAKNYFYDFSFYLNQRYGEHKWKEFIAQVTAGSKLEKAAIQVYGQTLYRLGGELLQSSLSVQPVEPAKQKTVQLGMFKITCDNADILDRDYPYLKYLMEKYEKNIKTTLFKDGTAQNQLEKTLQFMQDQSIQVYFLSTQKAVDQTFGSPWSTAETSFGFHLTKPGMPGQLYANMVFKYSSLLALNTLVHEMTHMLFALSRFDSDSLKNLDTHDPVRLKQKLQPVMQAFEKSTGSTVLSEGLAETMAGKLNLLQYYGIMSDVDDTIRWYCKKQNKIPDVMNLEKLLRSSNDNERVLAYQMAHSYTRYLINRFGMEKVLQLMETEAKDDPYQSILGTSYAQSLNDWKTALFMP